MAPFIPNGIYEIRNVEFTDCVAELVNGIPNGPICATKDRGSPDELWSIVNQGNGGNQITVESVSTPGSYVNARQIQGGSLVGSRVRTIWTVVKVDHGYYIQSPDANFVWELPQCPGCIKLVHHTGKDNTKWEFERVDD